MVLFGLLFASGEAGFEPACEGVGKDGGGLQFDDFLDVIIHGLQYYYDQ